ncbi:MAG: histidine phosphatase family protein [Planctomycetia bacterium]|nr:histidine phosphatase family protein [Planctomycetia bacterium]
MQLLIIRHARAADAHGIPDSQRPLTALGRREFEASVRWVVEKGVVPAHVFHSPAMRTTETAEILATAAGLTNQVREAAHWLALGVGLDEILPMVSLVPSEITALVGHEPNMSALASSLIGGGWVSFRPGTIACIEFESAIAPGLGKLNWLLDAGMFE